jgi:hypothetical protein
MLGGAGGDRVGFSWKDRRGGGRRSASGAFEDCPRCARWRRPSRPPGDLGGRISAIPGDLLARVLPRLRSRIASRARCRIATKWMEGQMGPCGVGRFLLCVAALVVSGWSTPPRFMPGRSFSGWPARIDTSLQGLLPARCLRCRSRPERCGWTKALRRFPNREPPGGNVSPDDSDVQHSASELGSEERERFEKTLDWIGFDDSEEGPVLEVKIPYPICAERAHPCSPGCSRQELAPFPLSPPRTGSACADDSQEVANMRETLRC